MARLSTPWRALRPVILAGAAAVTWLTLSSTAASADTLPDSSSLLGNATSSVSSLSHDLAATVSLVPAGSPAGTFSGPGLLQPVVAPVSGLTDNLIAAVPVVDRVVPPGTVSAVSAPVVELADTVTAGMAQVVVAPAAEAIPVLQPVSDIMTGTAPLPVPPLEAAQADVPAVPAPAPAEDQPAALQETPVALEAGQVSESLSPTAQASGNAVLETAGPGILANAAVQKPAVSGTADVISDQPLPAAPSPVPAQAPAAPASGTGSGGSSGGPSGAAAWLNPFDLEFVPAGAVYASEAPEHAPAPVSFDPGSSPD
ncbi:hypothetical protein NG819_19195 [Pseudarthrobacter sp. Fe7]|nr:hypothetical protein NG819_19195 [Pseudarthrobacter sp. Fe7]